MAKSKPWVIVLNTTGGVRYLADKPEWDGAWYTAALSRARRYVRDGNAQRVLESYGSAWDVFRPRVEHESDL